MQREIITLFLYLNTVIEWQQIKSNQEKYINKYILLTLSSLNNFLNIVFYATLISLCETYRAFLFGINKADIFLIK